MADERGLPWEFDAGPSKSGGWPELFAETPNYRALGRAVVGREAFRWHFGPMFYRGRLDGSARVVVIGQEGAQDESLSHRSFTGGTGGHMQHFLAYLGIDRSYLFLNTFVYPIFGEYTSDLRRLAQDLRSPVVSHRHRILDKVVEEGDVRLVVAVGKAAKESVATWVRGRGGTADPASLHLASVGPSVAGLRVMGVRHPGGATSGSLKDIKSDFTSAAGLIADGVRSDPAWLPPDATTSPTSTCHTSTRPRRSPTATSPSGPALAWAGSRPRRTARTASAASSCSPQAGGTTARGRRSTTPSPPRDPPRALPPIPATSPTSRPGPIPAGSTPARRRRWPGC